MRDAVEIAMDWAIRAFGRKHVERKEIRALRVAEEAIELAQSCGITQTMMNELVATVYARPVGHFYQEAGGVLMTINVMCAGQGLDPDTVFRHELMRVLDKPIEHFTQRNKEKMDAP